MKSICLYLGAYRVRDFAGSEIKADSTGLQIVMRKKYHQQIIDACKWKQLYHLADTCDTMW